MAFKKVTGSPNPPTGVKQHTASFVAHCTFTMSPEMRAWALQCALVAELEEHFGDTDPRTADFRDME